MAPPIQCCFISTLVTLFGGLIFTMMLCNYQDSITASMKTCSIDGVSYTKNITDREHMVSCDCGKNCMLDEGTCGKVFLSTGNITNKMVFPDLEHNHEAFRCTFQEKRCKEVLRSQALEEIKQEAQPYIDLMNSNSTIDCYVLDGDIYLENTFDPRILIVLGIVFGLLLCCWLGIVISMCCEEKRHSSTNNVVDNVIVLDNVV